MCTINRFFLLSLSLSLLSSLAVQSEPIDILPSPYLSPTTIFQNYQKMVRSFKIFIYNTNESLPFNSPSASLFYTSLQNSHFFTQNPEEAHLFFVPFSSGISTRSIARRIRELRAEFPFWNRSLGADHFFFSCPGISRVSDRNLVELMKNSVQISCFPAADGKFIPHKDVTLPPLSHPNAPATRTAGFLGYASYGALKESTLIEKFVNNTEFLIESEPSNELTRAERLANSEFCLFDYGGGDVSAIGEALRFGCVPVVITDRPIQDLPFMDVLKWQEIALLVGSKDGIEGLKHTVARACGGGCERMRELGMTAGGHFVWNEMPQPYDAFHMVMYQLWLRRHAIRYARREWI